MMKKYNLLSHATVFLLVCGLMLSACSPHGGLASETVPASAETFSEEITEAATAESPENGRTETAEDSQAETAEDSQTETAEDSQTETTEGLDDAAENTGEKALENMLMAMDALMMSAVETGLAYDPADPEFFWAALYRELNIYSSASSLISFNESGEIQVPRQTAQEFATGLFADYSDLPEIPDVFSPSLRYDESWDAYQLSPGDRGLSAPEILSASETTDGGYDVTARLDDVTDSTDICVYLFHLVPNAYADGITDPLFFYSVESMEPAG